MRQLAVIRHRGKSNVPGSVDWGSSPCSNSVCYLVQIPSLPQALLTLGEMRALVLPVILTLRFYNVRPGELTIQASRSVDVRAVSKLIPPHFVMKALQSTTACRCALPWGSGSGHTKVTGHHGFPSHEDAELRPGYS